VVVTGAATHFKCCGERPALYYDI